MAISSVIISIASAIPSNFSPVIPTLSSWDFAIFLASFIVLTAAFVSCINSSIISSISSANLPDSSASFLISSATTENPLPASPALAASMAALRANRLVCPAIFPIISLALSILFALSLVFKITLCMSSVALLFSCVLPIRSFNVSNPSSFKIFICSALLFIFLNSCWFFTTNCPNSSMCSAPSSVSFAWSFAPPAISSTTLAISSTAVADC